MSTIRTRAAAIAVGAVLLAGCGQATDPGDPPADTPTAPDGTTPPESPGESPSSPPGEEPSDEHPPQVTAAIADLAAHLGVDPGDIEVVRYEDVTWSDGSLGCPQPGMSYTQALVPGARLVLEAQEQEFFYHAGPEPELERCDEPQEPITGATS